MVMTDIVFVFIFLPVSLLTIMFKPKYQKYILLFLSLFYYACGSPKYFFLFCGVLAINVGISYLIQFADKKRNMARCFLLVGVFLNVGLLFYYKYFDFAIAGLNRFCGMAIPAQNLLLPMGISFFTFKSISLLIDVYKGTVVLKENPACCVLYLSFFGQIVSGPICRYNDFYDKKADECNNSKAVWKMLSNGSYLFVRGFIKKILLANILSLVVAEVFSMDLELTSAPLLWLGSICYSLQLYYDFSGYSDMAIGIGEMYGISCPINFDYPYITKSVSEFWRRWHISLGAWFRDYIYIPLGGSRVNSKRRLLFNLFIVWMLTGIWHGANWTFIFWGLGYFVVISFEKVSGFPNKLKLSLSKIIYRIFTLAFINFQWVIFNSKDLITGLRYIKHMIIGYGDEIANSRTLILSKEYGIIIFFAIIFATPVIPWLKRRFMEKGDNGKYFNVITGLIMGVLFIIALSFVITGQNNPFLYGNF